MTQKKVTLDVLDSINFISQIIFDKKGFNIFAMDVRGISSISDFIIIAEGNVDRHVTAIANTIVKEMKKKGQTPLYTEGMKEGDWIVLDYSDVMVHLFMPGLREKYQLEKLWPDGKIIDLDLDISEEKNQA